jgi:hypothetical protein
MINLLCLSFSINNSLFPRPALCLESDKDHKEYSSLMHKSKSVSLLKLEFFTEAILFLVLAHSLLGQHHMPVIDMLEI